MLPEDLVVEEAEAICPQELKLDVTISWSRPAVNLIHISLVFYVRDRSKLSRSDLLYQILLYIFILYKFKIRISSATSPT